MREVITKSQHLSGTLVYLATGNDFDDLTFVSATSLQSIGDMFTAQQTDDN
jgi:hypothetical protein